MPAATIHILGICGSLRAESYNRVLLVEAAAIAPEGVEIEIFEGLADIPLFNEDVEAEGEPEAVRSLKDAIASADALLIATPEYNYSVSGVLKNAIDWASRPAGESPLEGKPTALIGASPGMGGSARAQLALRQSFVFTKTPVLPGPEVLVARAHERIEDGQLTDKDSREFLGDLIERLREFTVSLRDGDEHAAGA